MNNNNNKWHNGKYIMQQLHSVLPVIYIGLDNFYYVILLSVLSYWMWDLDAHSI